MAGRGGEVDPSVHILEEILIKFVYNAPAENLIDCTQLMFLVEHAWWYYEDCVREKPGNQNLRHYANYNTFASMLFNKCEVLQPHLAQLPKILDEYRQYKAQIPVYGAILLDAAMERVLLVRGYKSNSGWGFPRGKVNRNESEVDCACREVMEETGMVIDDMIVPEHCIEATMDGKLNKLYIITGLDPETARFAPKVQKEIGAYAWHYVNELPASGHEADQAYLASGGNRHRFFMVQPFVRKLRSWISQQRRRLNMPPATWDPTQAGSSAAAAGSQAAKQRKPGKEQAATAAVAAATQATQLLSRQGSVKAFGAGQNLPSVADSGVQQLASEAPNLVMSSAFRFDRQAILRCLA
mmetsp:Transcript_22857/g.58241  ORF Transcript_22857/g.58241 Transcript_22857/m.58241 type:complete len:354 (-) Transcript_22857:491-1552(-)|eukprot:CAMPEP_0202862012 /NCGR_PEP_ID=MMETSP1391-20130828/3216_1 /ASSEMBLY_ACC=CAM_ASM_000867 /TAXON_ID=1034604 /ORGANISM="Chlamydomonas leiostraca, Strain SAG 11-49" /LENGTH=353 /DNA_ID=CAMNT_0049541491 /DNA_START=84 /DNA_END=1145 /DNA_ORIENTATION=-